MIGGATTTGSYGVVVARPLSHPVFHDLVKSILQWDAPIIHKLGRSIPSLKDSSLLDPEKWSLTNTYQEVTSQSQNTPRAKKDVVWVLTNSKNNQKYRIIHEVKTGKYDAQAVLSKYYSWSLSQVWIWGWSDYNHTKLRSPKLRVVNIEHLLPLIKPHVDRIASLWEVE